MSPTPPEPDDGLAIGPAREAELPALVAIEQRAAALFTDDDLPPAARGASVPLESYAEACRAGRLFVARLADAAGRARPVGFALLAELDGHAHLEELDVHPEFMRRGIGRRLVAAALEHARRRGLERMTLSTFRDLPWNGPFYASMGFEPIPEAELGPGLRARREGERRTGFDMARRWVMGRSTAPRKGPDALGAERIEGGPGPAADARAIAPVRSAESD